MDVVLPWAQAAGVVALGVGGVFAGRWISGRGWWLVACLAAMALVVTFGTGRWAPRLELVPPFSWVMAGRLEYALLAPAAAVALVPPTVRLRLVRQRLLVAAFLVLVLAQYAVMPFLSPAFARPRLGSLKTQIDADGVCRQTTAYTCGPAAAVTALRRLGIAADESDLALRMFTCPTLGTPADVLASSLESRYASNGLRCDYRSFDSLDSLPRDRPTLAVVKHSFMVDHFVAVLDVGPEGVLVGDPQLGRINYPRDAFERRWRFMGVVLSRDPAAAAPAEIVAGAKSSVAN